MDKESERTVWDWEVLLVMGMLVLLVVDAAIDNGGRCGNGYGKGGKCSRRGNVSRGGCNVLLFW